MALIKCPDCERDISPRALQCPFCGCPAEFFYTENQNDSKNEVNVPVEIKREENVDNNTRLLRERLVAILKRYAERRNTCNFVAEDVQYKPENELLVSVSSTGIYNGKTIRFGQSKEKYHDNTKSNFDVIQDSERETDDHDNGLTHVVFRLGDNKYISVSKSNLFYAPINTDSNKKIEELYNSFRIFITDVNDLKGLTDTASDEADRNISKLMEYYVKKLVSLGIFEYDIKNFADECGSDVLLSNSNAFASIMSQIEDVSDYADHLSYKRNVERASRSQWQGGGFGLGGAIKGAITAGALNAATGAFRSVGDSMTDAGDRDSIKSKYESIVNSTNKNALLQDFYRCLLYTRKAFFSILHRRTGWDANGILQTRYEEYGAKLKNIDMISDPATKEQVFFEVLSESPFNQDAIKYAFTNYERYGLNIGDLFHYVQRVNPDACRAWMKNDFSNKILSYVMHSRGDKRIQSLVNAGVSFKLIDKDFNIINNEFGPTIILYMIMSEINDAGYNIFNIESLIRDASYSEMEGLLNSLRTIGSKYHVISDEEIKRSISLLGTADSYEPFVAFKGKIDKQLDINCVVNKVQCDSILEAKLLKQEWDIYDSIYKIRKSYADYDSSEMEEVIKKMTDNNFKSKHILQMVDGLKNRKSVLESHEIRPEYVKRQQVIQKLRDKADGKFVVYGTDGFLEKAERVFNLGHITKREGEFYPCVIYDASDSSSFKGFVITDNYFYNYNPFLIGAGEKEVALSDVKYTEIKGKNRVFHYKNGNTEKLKIIDKDELIIGILSDVYGWSETGASNNNKMQNGEKNALVFCPNCNKAIKSDSKFCIYCGNKIADDKQVEKAVSPVASDGNIIERVCFKCGKTVPHDVRFCVFCGNKMSVMDEDTEQTVINDIPDNNTSTTKQCPACKKIVGQGIKFCVYCGHAF